MIEYLTEAIAVACVLGVGGLFLRVRTNENKISVIEDQVGTLVEERREVSELARVTVRLDERLKHLPTHSDLDRVHDRISKNGDKTGELQVCMSAVQATLSGLRQAVDRLHRAEEARES